MMLTHLLKPLRGLRKKGLMPLTHETSGSAGVTISLEALIALRREAQGLSCRQHQRVSTAQSGHYLSRFRGRGMDFAEVRHYQPGDDIRFMDWRVTARCGQPHMKIFQEERERPMFLIVDQGTSMQFGTRVAFKSVIAAQAAALLAWAVAEQGDRVGGIIFGRQPSIELRPYGRQRGVLPLLKALSESSPAVAVEGGFQQALAGLQQMARPGSLIILISDFVDFNEEARRYVGALARHCKIQAVIVYDPLEQHLPPEGRYRFTDGEQALLIETGDAVLQAQFHQQFQQRIQTVTHQLTTCGVSSIQLKCGDPIAQVLHHFL